MTYDVSGGPSDGTVTLSPQTGAFDYTPRQAPGPLAGDAGTLRDSFSVTINDGQGDKATLPVAVAAGERTTEPTTKLVVSGSATSGDLHVSVNSGRVTYLVVHDPALATAAREALEPFDEHVGAENPYTLHTELQQSMNDLVGIIRTKEEIEQALVKLDDLKRRMHNVTVEGHRQFNPGWHLAIDMRNMLLVSECVAKAALARTESRGGHTRDDHPEMSADWRNILLVCSAGGGDPIVPDVTVTPEQQVPMPAELLGCFELSELEKYYTDAELAAHPERS